MEYYAESLTHYKRLLTREVKVGDLLLGNFHPIRIQTMTTTDTMNTIATVEQTIRCIEAGAELVRITAPSKLDAENLLNIKNELHRRGYHVPLVADIHFTPNAAEVAARIVEKVRVNPGNYVDKKKFEQLEYTNAEYQEEIERIRDRFTPLVRICREYGTAMRIGTNHGSLSDRIMSRYGDTPMGMVESAMEFLRVCRDENFHQIVLSMKASNPQVMVQAYRLLIKTMDAEFGEIYPLHLGVTEAGDGEEGRIKSAIGIGALLEDGIGDTIRVSLTEDPELEIPVCRDIVKRYDLSVGQVGRSEVEEKIILPYDPFQYNRRKSVAVGNVGGKKVPVVIADFSQHESLSQVDLASIGYTYKAEMGTWQKSDAAADYVFIDGEKPGFDMPQGLRLIAPFKKWADWQIPGSYPLYRPEHLLGEGIDSTHGFLRIDNAGNLTEKASRDIFDILEKSRDGGELILCVGSTEKNAMQRLRVFFMELMRRKLQNPVVLMTESNWQTADEHLIHFATETGALFLDGFGDGIWLQMNRENRELFNSGGHGPSGRTYARPASGDAVEAFLNNTAFSILQATRTRISKTEYISCPSCGRTLFELQETTQRIRKVTSHLKGVKIAIMGCIVNGPGEMADADFGYVGSGPGKITLYKGKEIVKRSVDSEVAVDELIRLLKENNVWIEPS